jgi:hypothetical protein
MTFFYLWLSARNRSGIHLRTRWVLLCTFWSSSSQPSVLCWPRFTCDVTWPSTVNECFPIFNFVFQTITFNRHSMPHTWKKLALYEMCAWTFAKQCSSYISHKMWLINEFLLLHHTWRSHAPLSQPTPQLTHTCVGSKTSSMLMLHHTWRSHAPLSLPTP